MNNFLIDNGDIDICIVPKFNNVNDFAPYLDKIKDEITNRNIGEHKLSYQNKRYVLLRIMDNQMKCIVDITAHTMLPIHNTNLIRLYSLFDQRFHIMGLYVKHWAKINKIHGAAEHYLSSYALLLMLIHFLQEIAEPHVLPNLQKIDPHKEIPYEYYYDGKPVVTNIYYEEDLNKIKSYMSKVNSGMRNTETPTALLIKFFEYYAYSFDSENTISIKRDILNNEPIRKKTENYAFSIEDPFDLYHNPGKSMMMNSIQYHKFLTAMKKEINFILNGEYVTRLDKILTNGGSGGSSAVVNSNSNNNNASANASGNNVNGDNSSNNNNNKA
jgi:DNA polymerase sigma